MGNLSEHPLAELIREISLKRLSGTLRLQHEQAKVAVYFDAGHVIYAASNLKELRVGEYLKKHGLISERDLTALGTKRSDASLIAALNAGGVIDRKKIESVVAKQVADLLRVAVLWTSGSWEFDNRSHLGDPVRVRLDTAPLLLQTARKMESNFVASRFPSPDELVSLTGGSPEFNHLLPAEGFVLSRLDGPTKLRDLIALSGQSEPDAIKMIYGLALGGFLERENWAKALRLEQQKVPPIPLTQPFEETAPAQTEASSEVDVYDLDNFLVRLERASNHYEVLNVGNTASLDEVKANYYALARRYHPDRFHLQASTELHARIESAFARIAQAYEILTNPSRRSGYDAKLAAVESTRQLADSAPKPSKDRAGPATTDDVGAATMGTGSSQTAEENFRQGYAALQQGRTKLAIASLATAARLAPQEPRYRAFYGRALTLMKETRRLAEAELQAALKLEPGNSSYRVMLAELYYELGFLRRAERELESAVSSDPNSPEARSLMLKLNAARTTK